MEWKFRKCLETMESYRNINTIKYEFQRNNQQTINIVIRQIQIILNDHNEKILAKVLSLRFLREIMLLGKQYIIDSVQKLLTSLVPICSYRIEETQQTRGQTYFHNHPSYLRSNEQGQKQIDVYGSSYFVQCLQSVYTWAKWIPIDHLGNQSRYSKVYNMLLERGVKFPTNFHYYKPSDTERFKNLYKVEFFQESVQDLDSHLSSSELISKNNSSIYLQNKNKYNIQQIKQQLQELSQYPKMYRFDKLQNIAIKLQSNYHLENQNQWVDQYLINYGILQNKQISYQQFLQKVTTEKIQIGSQYQQVQNQSNKFKKYQLNNKDNSNINSIAQNNNYNKDILINYTHNANNANNNNNNNNNNNKQEQTIIFKQLIKNKNIVIQLTQQLNRQKLNNKILQENNKKQKQLIIEQYQNRIIDIKEQLKNNKDKLLQKIKEENILLNQKLKNMEIKTSRKVQQGIKIQQLQQQRQYLSKLIHKLEDQNSKLKEINKNYKKIQESVDYVKTSFNGLYKSNDNQSSQRRQIEQETILKNKQLKSLADQLLLYKSELTAERNKSYQEISKLQSEIQILKSDKNQLKISLKELQKKYDRKQIQCIGLRDDIQLMERKIKSFQSRPFTDRFFRDPKDQSLSSSKDKHYKSKQVLVKNQLNSYYPEQSSKKYYKTNQHLRQQIQTKSLKYTSFVPLLSAFQQKQSFLRYCRCALKQKDILNKENQLQIGLITQNHQKYIHFIIHLTNTSQYRLLNITIEYNIPKTINYTLQQSNLSDFIYCIEPRQQQKIILKCQCSLFPFFENQIFINITFEKNQETFVKKLLLPMVITKFLKYSKYTEENRQAYCTIAFKYLRKMIPKKSYLNTYFPPIQQVIKQELYLVDAQHINNFKMTIKIEFKKIDNSQMMNITIMTKTNNVNKQQKYIIQQFMALMEFVFSK